METKNRVGFLDELRGFAIICMVVYHLMVDLKFVFNVDVPIFFESWFDIIRDVFVGIFISISGIVCNYSRSNVKRGVQCFFIGMIITFVTAFLSPSSPDMFGILHCLGVCMMLYGLGQPIFEKIPAFAGIIINVLIFVFTFNFKSGYTGIYGFFRVKMPDILYSTSVLFPLGFPGKGFTTLDYFPLFPWLFLFIAGAFYGVYVKNGHAPKFFYKTHIPFFAAAGRHSIWIYVLHQPIIYPVLCLIFGRSIF
ncbi:MAG: DUF1624 domain-containing protein [Ruminiclostridium sp.]|nr:DUF1624 domain-containing protein [Ruminiclostridium sp.]